MSENRTIPALPAIMLWIALMSSIAVRASAAESATAPSTQISSPDREAALAGARDHFAAGSTWWNKGEIDRALAEEQASLDLYQKIYAGQDHPDTAHALTAVASCLLRLNRLDEAFPRFTAAMELLQRLNKKQDSQDLAIATANVGWCLHCLERDEDIPTSSVALLQMKWG